MKILRRFRFYFLEENKFRKYALYAIGEVILIVIGILIALQLNNLNENKIDRERERIYLEEYLNDLVICKTDLQRTIKRTNENYISIDNLLNAIQNEELDFDRANVMAQGGESFRFRDEGIFRDCVKPFDLELMREIDARCDYNILHICDYHDGYDDLNTFLDYPGQVVNCSQQVGAAS